MTKVIHILPHNIEDYMVGDYTNFDHHSVRFLTKVAKFWFKHNNAVLAQELWVLSKKCQSVKEFKHEQGFKLKLFPVSLGLPLPLEMSWPLLKEVKKYKSQPGVVWHLHSYYLLMNDLLAVRLRLQKQPFVMHYRGGSPSWTAKACLYTIYHYLIGLRLALNLANNVFVQNYDEVRRVINWLGVKEKKVVYFPNSVPLSSLIDQAGVKSNFTAGAFKIITAGRTGKLTSHRARLDIINKILQANKDCLIEIIGVNDAGDFKKYISVADQPRLILTPWLDKQTLLNKLSAAALFLHINDKDEGSPMTLIEAQSQSVPVIAVDIAGVRDIIKNGVNGYLVDNLADLPDQIAKIMANGHLSEMRANSRQNVRENFIDEKYFPQLIKIYQDLSGTGSVL